MPSSSSTFKQHTVTTVDIARDGDDLAWTVFEAGSDDDVLVLLSGDFSLAIRRDDLAFLSNVFGTRA